MAKEDSPSDPSSISGDHAFLVVSAADMERIRALTHVARHGARVFVVSVFMQGLQGMALAAVHHGVHRDAAVQRSALRHLGYS